jgi:hypothetical protein
VKALAATFLAMLFVDTIGAIDPYKGRVYLPSPRVYVATFLLWGVLGVVAGFGEHASRLAGRIGAVVLLVATVIGPFGKKAVGFVNATSKAFPATQEGTS